MPEGVEFPFPSLLFYEGRTYGQPEVVRISLPQVALFARGAHSMQAVMHRAHSYAEGVPADTILFYRKC